MLNKVPKIFRSFYFLVGLFFIVWMLFIDSADIFTHSKLRGKLSDLEAEKVFYERKIQQVEADREALMNNKELLERFAREKYFMKKPDEDVFVVVDKN